jgi:hypothetical protein
MMPQASFPVPLTSRWYYRGPQCRIVPLTEPGLWVPLSCAIAIIAGDGSQSPGTTSATVTLDTTGANLVVLYGSAYSAVTISDSHSTSWNALTTFTDAFGIQSTIYWAQGLGVGAGSTFTASGTLPCVAALAVSGAAASPFDQQNGQTFPGSGTSRQPGPITASVNGSLFVASCSMDGEVSTSTVNSPFTMVSTKDQVGGSAVGYAFAQSIQAVAGTENPTFTFSVGNMNFGNSQMATFQPAGVSSVLLNLLH